MLVCQDLLQYTDNPRIASIIIVKIAKRYRDFMLILLRSMFSEALAYWDTLIYYLEEEDKQRFLLTLKILATLSVWLLSTSHWTRFLNLYVPLKHHFFLFLCYIHSTS